MKLVPVLSALLFLNLFLAPLGAQEVTGSIRGMVLDPSGAGVRAAEVTASQVETGLTRTAVSDHNGAYVLVLLPVGHYRLEATAKGFRKYAQEGRAQRQPSRAHSDPADDRFGH